MAIQKLLPSSGHTHNGVTSCFIDTPYSQPIRLGSLYSGIYISSSSVEDSFVNYLAKSVSSPDDNSYVGTYSGYPYPIDLSYGVNITSEFEQCNINLRGLKTRIRYKGIAASSPFCYVEYFLTDTDGTSHSLAYTPGWHNPTYTGNSSSSFVTFLTDSVVVGDSGWVMPVEMIDNLINSGAYLRASIEFYPATIPVEGYDFGRNVYTVSGPASKVSALEIETSGEIIAKHMRMYLHLPPIPISGDVGFSISGMVTMNSGLPMHSYCTPTTVSGGIDFYTKRHGYINSIEEVVVSGGVSHLYPTSGTYANGSGALFSFNCLRDTTYRDAIGYNGILSGVMSPSYSGHNPMVDYISESTDSPNNISYIEIADSPSFNSGYLQNPRVRIGTQLDRLVSVPKYLQANISYSGDYSQGPLKYSSAKFESHFYLTLNSTTYEIGYIKDQLYSLNFNSQSFMKASSSKLYFDGTSQPSPFTVLNISGDLLSNIINSGATFSTYTYLYIDDESPFYGYRKYHISAFDIDASGLPINMEIPHPQLYIKASDSNSENFNISIPNVTIPIDSGLSLYVGAKSEDTNNLNLYTSGNNQINSGLSFAIPSPSFAIKDMYMYIEGNYLTSIPLYIEQGQLKNISNNILLGINNNYSSGEITKNIYFHTSNQSGVEDNIYMFIGGNGSFSGNTNLPMFINSFNQSGADNISLLINNTLASGNYGLDLYITNTVTESGNINLYINGGGYGANNNNVNLYVENTPYNLESGVSLFLSNNYGSILGPSGNNKPGNIDFHTYSIANSSGNMNLSIIGGRYGLSSDNINIYVNSDMPSGNIDLSIRNTLDYLNKDINFNLISILDLSEDLTFFVNGGGIDLRQGELNLFTRSAIANSGSIDFSILGNISREPINLSIKVNDLLEVNSGIPLSVFSALDSGVFNSFTITTKARGYEASLPMYIPADSTGNVNSNIYMVMLNDTITNKDVFLYVENNTETNSANYTLFTQGEGILKNGYISNSSMNLFINRGNESVYNTIPMTLNGPSGIFESVPLVISGGYINESGITLTMPSTSASIVNRADFYSHGFLY